MTKNLSPNTKIRHGSLPGSIRLDERARNLLPRSPIHIAPRPFVYDLLQPGDVRLLKIDPSRDRRTSVRAELKHQPLHNATYQTLSCALGPEELREIIYVNDQAVEIRGHLPDALRDVRGEIEDAFIWVDSICINQNDRKEVEQQRIRVKEIEDHATTNIHWPREISPRRRMSDGATLDAWLTAGKTSIPRALDPAPLRIGDIGSHNLLDIMYGQLYPQSLPALTYSLDSPQTNSASSSPDSNAELHIQPTTTLQSLPLRPASTDFWTWDVKDFDWQQQLKLGEEAMENSTNKFQRKRSLRTAFPGHMSAPYSQKVQQTQSTGADSNEPGPNAVFGCPFQKADPQKYHKCLKYTLNRIKDVKQHIYRQHSKPDTYCARCYEVFSSAGDRDAHSRREVCEKREPPQFEGISEQQRNELKKSTPKNKPGREQWFELWDAVFPGRQRPQSAFIGNYVEEMVPLLRNLWNNKKMEIISSVIDSRGGGNRADSKLLAEIMDSVFDRFEAETARSAQRSNTERSEPRTDSLELPKRTEPYNQQADIGFDFEAAFDQPAFSQMGVHEFNSINMGNYYPGCEGIGTLFDTDLTP